MRYTGFVMMVLFVFVVFQSAKAQEARDTAKQEEPIFEDVDILPIFPGGDVARQKFLGYNTVYPSVAREMGIEGKVIIGFVVEIDGSLSNFEVIESVHPALDAEVLRVVKLMPNWIPATRDGKPVRCRYNMPLKFVFEEYDPLPIKGKRKRR